jgi:hypothetical protein
MIISFYLVDIVVTVLCAMKVQDVSCNYLIVIQHCFGPLSCVGARGGVLVGRIIGNKYYFCVNKFGMLLVLTLFMYQ